MKKTRELGSRIPLSTPEAIREALLSLHREKGSWAKVGRYIGLPGGTLSSIANRTFEPTGEKNPEICKKLGWPHQLKVTACSRCGEVHVRECRPKRRPDLFSYSPDELLELLENRMEAIDVENGVWRKTKNGKT